MTEAMPFDAFILRKSGTGMKLPEAVKTSLTREGFLTPHEFSAFVKVGATDHASSVLNACKELGITSVGDPPHAVELVVKKIIRGMGLRPVLMSLRKTFTRKNSTLHQRLLSGFQISTSTFQMPMTRWSYWANMLRVLSKPETLARLQQLLLYMIKQLRGTNDDAAAPVEEEEEEDLDVNAGERDAWDEDDYGDLADPAEEGIPPAVRTQRQEKLLMTLQSAAKTLTDPVFHCKVMALAIVLRPLKNVNMFMQYATPDPATLTTLSTLYATLNSVLDHEQRELLLNPAMAPLTAATCDQPSSLTLSAIVTRNEATGEVSVVMPSTTPVYMQIQPVAAVAAVKAKPASGGQPAVKAVPSVKALTAAENSAAIWANVMDTIEFAVNAGVVTYNKRVRPVVELAERRHVASLYQRSKEYLDNVPFAEYLEDPTALPFVSVDGQQPRRPWTWVLPLTIPAAAGAATPAAASPEMDDDSHLEAKLVPALKLQWTTFKIAIAAATTGDPRTMATTDLDEPPARYWIRTRAFWPDLSELMLLWLTTPISTACVERGFSYLTMMDSNARRRRTKEPGFRAEFLAHLHRGWLRDQLREATQ